MKLGQVAVQKAMSALLEHILRRDVSKLRAYEVSECLFYLDRLSNPTAGKQENIADFRRKLNDKLSELRRAKKFWSDTLMLMCCRYRSKFEALQKALLNCISRQLLLPKKSCLFKAQ